MKRLFLLLPSFFILGCQTIGIQITDLDRSKEETSEILATTTEKEEKDKDENETKL